MVLQPDMLLNIPDWHNILYSSILVVEHGICIDPEYEVILTKVK